MKVGKLENAPARSAGFQQIEQRLFGGCLS